MATIREALLATADAVRALTAPSVWDIRTVGLKVEKRKWLDGRRGAGPMTVASVVYLPQRYKIRQVTSREIASSGGRYQMADVRVGPITPAYDDGGFTVAQLKPGAPENGVEYVYVLTGAEEGECELVNLDQFKALSYFLVLRRKRTTP